jgi:N-acetylmuramoyl-L-alanine amidase
MSGFQLGVSGIVRGMMAVGVLVAGTNTAFAQATAPATTSSVKSVAVAAAPAAKIDDSFKPGDAKSDKSRTRFVIGLDKAVDVKLSALANPSRIVVDLPDVRMQLPPEASVNQGGLVKSFTGGMSAPGRNRVVINVDVPVVIESHRIEAAKDGKSHRLILDIVAIDTKAAPKKSAGLVPAFALGAVGLGGGLGGGGAAPAVNAAPGLQPPLPKPAVRPSDSAKTAAKQIVVIDPGHGGKDSGASKFGAVEKNVVLAFSLALRDKLTATGRYKVLMTRDDDTFVPLDRRREFAEEHKAGLFIAVHADDSGGGSRARGATIYSLRDAVAKDLQRSAKGQVNENLLSAKDLASLPKNDQDVGTVKGILAEFAQRDVELNTNRTGLFARSVIDTMGSSTNMMSNPDRSAAFRVLKSATVPAVLIELAYVSNQQDAANLKSDAWRDKVATSITAAVENYFSNQLARM